MQAIARFHSLLRTWARTFGPYVVLEILLPGGTLIALLLFLYRRSQRFQVSRCMEGERRALHRYAPTRIVRDVELATSCSTSV